MATKKELTQAQTFSRRRLLTAFVSGAPGGQELEPAKPLRGVVIGAVLSVLVVAGSLIAGAFTGLQDDQWKVNSLVVVRETGARYVAINGQLYPVHNITSARLLAFSDSFRVVNISEAQAAGVDRGTVTVGIPGAPDALPPVGSLINDGWITCALSPTQVRTLVSADVPGAEPGLSMLVQSEGQHYYLHEGLRFPVAADDVNGFSLMLGFDANPDTAATVSARWLNLFTEARDGLFTLTVPDDGEEPPGPIAALDRGLVIGDVVVLRDAQGVTGPRYVINTNGELVELTEFAQELYFLGSNRGSDDVVTLEFSEAQTTTRQPPDVLVPPDWPEEIPAGMASGVQPCLQLARDEETGEPSLHLIETEEEAMEGPRPVQVDSGRGALVRLDGGGSQMPWAVIDEQGFMYQIPPGHPLVLDRLQYGDVEAPVVHTMWAELFPPGPTLTVEAAEQGLPQEAIDGMQDGGAQEEEEG